LFGLILVVTPPPGAAGFDTHSFDYLKNLRGALLGRYLASRWEHIAQEFDISGKDIINMLESKMALQNIVTKRFG
jgi:hypothetical protein